MRSTFATTVDARRRSMSAATDIERKRARIRRVDASSCIAKVERRA
jgi:hypothetical protein